MVTSAGSVENAVRARIDLDSVERALADELGTGTDGLIASAERHLCLTYGAKRARPQLVLLFGEMVNDDREALVNAAISVELIHSASLDHWLGYWRYALPSPETVISPIRVRPPFHPPDGGTA